MERRVVIMHELSIATSLVEIACEEAGKAGAEKIDSVHLRLGVLSGVVRDALLFSFDIATQDTIMEGASLEIEEVPAVVYCPVCREEKSLPKDLHVFVACCPDCGAVTPEVRSGKELEIMAIEVPV